MKMNKTVIAIIYCAIASLTIIGCKKDSTSSSNTQITTIGDKQAFGSDSVRSWVTTDGNKMPMSVGVTFKASALIGLPNMDTMYMLMLPAMSGMGGMMMATPFDHIEIDWSAHGDGATSMYNIPHLDCHFFTVDNATQMGIMAGPDSTLGMQYMPVNCIADGSVEAGMGTHWIDTTATEYHGGNFNHAFNYGFYHNNMTFIEAMCSNAFLSTKASFTGTIKQPGSFKMSGYYPTTYTISYNAATMEFTYSLDNLMHH